MSQYPAKQFNSKRLMNSLRRNVISSIPSVSNVHCVRALWHKGHKDAELLIANKRLSTDESLARLRGVQFFLSCITGTKNNRGNSNDTNIGVSYFICGCGVEGSAVFSTLHDANMDVELSVIKTKKDNKIEATLGELSIVVKDHNSAYAISLMKKSVLHCLTIAQNMRKEDVISSDQFKNFDKNPCRLVVCDGALVHALKNAVFNLNNDGMKINLTSAECCNNIDTLSVPATFQSSETNGASSNALNVVGRAMKNAGHSLYRGNIYCKYNGAEYAYKHMCGVEEYLNTLLTIPDIQNIILKNWPMLIRMISSPYCKVLPQMTFLEDLVEIRGGKCLKLSSRYFIDTPLEEKDLGLRSPRGFHDYDYSPTSDGGYFESSVKNSFPDVFQRVNFLNKFYQCLLVGQLPLKTRKLLVVGPADSGKSSWAEVLFGIVPENKVATISKEKCFGFSMIEEDTQLIFIDEWSSDTFGSDQAKIFLQGGTFTQAVKHRTPRMLNNAAGVYITCNNVPDFGDEQSNVERRLAIFETSSLVEKNVEAPAWMKANAMRCLVWMIKEINRNIDMVDPSERFYEKRCDEFVEARLFGKIPTAQENKLRLLSVGSLAPVHVEKAPVIDENVLNAGFTSERTVIDTHDEQCTNENTVSAGADNACIQQNSVTSSSSSDVDSETERRLLGPSSEDDDKESCEKRPETPLSPNSLDWKSKKRFSVNDVNSREYHSEVRRILMNNMDKKGDLEGVHFLSFCQRYDRCRGKSYRGGDPSYDAWMLMKGENRLVFDAHTFFKRYPSTRIRLQRMRQHCRLRVEEQFARITSTKS